MLCCVVSSKYQSTERKPAYGVEQAPCALHNHSCLFDVQRIMYKISVNNNVKSVISDLICQYFTGNSAVRTGTMSRTTITVRQHRAADLARGRLLLLLLVGCRVGGGSVEILVSNFHPQYNNRQAGNSQQEQNDSNYKSNIKRGISRGYIGVCGVGDCGTHARS